ncbi:phosphoglycolate phosphatase [Halovenus aranensis]|jgi:phosphoglycolate phosphatase|uniref:Phosphoglycolate phosphatase n=1 Tax=Halovenus aranensis TaxID=890420 RepID=A0A1G8V6K5_9EURY|nr:HAD hydrolase-like protein [Halovenus aranensis]SDJ61494.1 phosphoglycolate phosphatase [Halovenus aranensis]
MLTDEYETIVYDLDGTLVRLRVDWDQARADTALALRERGIDADGQTLWKLLERGTDEGFAAVVERELAAHERDGARTSTLLDAASALPHDVPTGVCSLNCEDACRLALETHDLAAHVGAVVGRDTVSSKKPDPEPLLRTVDLLSGSPSEALFIGDSERDEITADRAGVAFQYVEDYLDARAD